MNKNDSDTRQKVFIAGFLIVAAVIVVICFLVNIELKKFETPESNKPEITSAVADTEVSEKETEYTESTEVTEITEVTEVTEPVISTAETSAAVDPSRIVWEDDVSEVGFSDVILDKTIEENKTFKADLSRFVSEGDKIDSFRFVFHAEDGASPLGEVKGGFGISVDNSCEARTDDVWYQTPDDFTVQTDESTCEVEWKVPDEIKDYIIVSEGQVLFGYWWSNADRVVLDKIICTHKNMKILPDETSSSN